MFLRMPPPTKANSELFAMEAAEDGYVANSTRLWGWRPDLCLAFLELRKLLTEHAALSLRDRAVLVCAAAAKLGDSYCALAWGNRLAAESSPSAAAAVLQCKETTELTERENALAAWARRVVDDPNATTADDVDRLRAVGLTDAEIFDATVFIAFRVAFSTVNDALGARPDRQLAESTPAAIRDAVVYGRSAAADASQ